MTAGNSIKVRSSEMREQANHKQPLQCSAQCPNTSPTQALLMIAFVREGSAPPSRHSPRVKGLLTLPQYTWQLPREDGIKLPGRGRRASRDQGLQTWQGMTGPGPPHTSYLHHSSSQKGSERSRRNQEGGLGPRPRRARQGPQAHLSASLSSYLLSHCVD